MVDLRDRVASLETAVELLTKRVEHAEDIGPMLYRLDSLERREELAPVLAHADLIDDTAGRRTVVEQDWEPGELRRVFCTAATGSYVGLLSVTEPILADYARRNRWDLVVERDVVRSGAPAWLKFDLLSELLDEFEIAAWIDADAVIFDQSADLGLELTSSADVYVTEPIAAAQRGPAPDSGVLVVRSTPAARALLEAIRSRSDGDPDEVLGALLQERWSTCHTQWLPRKWNSMPAGAREQRPAVVHYAAMPYAHRRQGLIGAAADVRRSDPIGVAPVLDVPSREDLPRLLNRLGLLGTAVEVGVRNGAFSAWILHRWQGFRLISVDPWQTVPSEEYVDIANVPQSRHDDLHSQARARLLPFGARSEIMHTTGAIAAETIRDGTIDFVYLDAMHDEQSVTDDLGLWYPKLIPGGVIAGHDYLDGDLPEGIFGVKTAVDRFFASRDLCVCSTSIDAPWASWFVVTPNH